MTKADIIKQIHANTGISRDAVMLIFDTFIQTIKSDMVCGNNVYLRGFGSFVLKHHGEKRSYNINNGTYKSIPAHDVPTFKPGKEMMARTNALEEE